MAAENKKRRRAGFDTQDAFALRVEVRCAASETFLQRG